MYNLSKVKKLHLLYKASNICISSDGIPDGSKLFTSSFDPFLGQENLFSNNFSFIKAEYSENICGVNY